MKSIVKIYLFLFLFSCKNGFDNTYDGSQVIEVKNQIDSNIVKIIYPYKINLDKEMNKIISYTISDLEKGKPEGRLGNFICDLSLIKAEGKAEICVFNNGGLRDIVSKGNITTSDIFQVMPFENELVIIEIDNKEYYTLLKYITDRGGEPFSGTEIIKENDTILSDFNNYKKIRVLTSDYLANGGDNMDFFIGKNQNKLGIKLRDAIIEYCENKDTLKINLDNRLVFKNE